MITALCAIGLFGAYKRNRIFINPVETVLQFLALYVMASHVFIY